MPILINSVNFSDNFGNTNGFYKSNTVDKMTATFLMESTIRMTSQGNPLNLDPTLNQVTSPGVSWIGEGFRVGDWVLVYLHNPGGSVLAAWWTQITYVDAVMCDFGAMPLWYDITQNQFITMYAVQGPGTYNARARAEMDLLFNHVKNNNPGSEFSLIDGEVTRAIFQGIDGLTVGGSINGILTGNQSGQFVISATLTRVTNAASGFYAYSLAVEFMNSGMYDVSWFQSSDCLKVFAKMLWASYAGEPFERTESIYSLEANTGWFNEANNSSINDSTLISGPGSVDYCVPSTFDIVVDGPLAGLGIGAAYRSITDDYYRIQTEPQQELAMAIGTEPAAIGVLNSFVNPDGAAYTLEVNSITTLLTTHTINVTITPNPQFNTFMGNVDDGDRLFYIWVKCGNINHLAFGNQLTCAPPVGGPLIMEQDTGYLDHSENVEDITGDRTGFIADTEDDVAYIGKFKLNKNEVLETFTARLEAHNTVTGDTFTLESATFGFSGVLVSGAGVYLLNETQNITTELPTTSVKRDARLVLEPSLDTATEFGVKIYAPWILNWRYWQPLLSASVDFYPTQNQDWEQYDNAANWEIRTHLELVKEGLAYVHENVIIDRPYDAEPLINSSIDLFLEPTLTPVSVAPSGSIIRVISTHERTDGNAWDPSLTWGMITVEDFEQAPRWICSSVVDYDNNIANPLTPLSGLLINITFPAPNIAVLECILEADKLNLTNGVSIGAKIKENEKGVDGFLITQTKEFTRSYSVFQTAAPAIYSGPIMTIRRQTDNAELDIYGVFDGTNWLIDTTAMLAFVGDGQTANAWVAKWFDQSATSVIPATQSALNSQPQIVRNGAIVIDPDNGLPGLDFDGVDDFFDLPQPLGSSTQIIQAMQYSRSQGTTTPLEFSFGFCQGSNNLPYAIMHVLGNYLFSGINNPGGIGNIHQADPTPIVGPFLNLMWRRVIDDDIYMNSNGNALTTVNGPNNTPLPFRKIGDSGNPGWLHKGIMQELNAADGGFDEVFIQGNMNFRFNSF